MKVNNDRLRFIHEFNNEFMMRTDKIFLRILFFLQFGERCCMAMIFVLTHCMELFVFFYFVFALMCVWLCMGLSNM